MRNRLRPGIALLITIIGLLAAGCAGSDNTASGGAASGGPGSTAPAGTQAPSAAVPSASAAAPSTPRAAAADTARCHTSQLSGRVRMLEPAAGNRYAALVLTNTSNRHCTTYGFVGMQLAGAKGNDLPTEVVRETRPAAVRVTLRPGQSAWTRIHWTVAAGSGESSTGQCEPTPSRLLVIPPDERTQLTAKWPGGSVCEHGKILTTALAAGAG
ncbi:MAG TPA: DUF4232 domain-containing protein [Streptosporangiaceae bacterium]|jgi:hypothetical protein